MSSSGWVFGSRWPERVEVGDEMAAHAVHVDQLLDVHRLVGGGERVFERGLTSTLQRAGSYGTSTLWKMSS